MSNNTVLLQEVKPLIPSIPFVFSPGLLQMPDIIMSVIKNIIVDMNVYMMLSWYVKIRS